MAQKIAKYVNPVLHALKSLGGSGQPSEVCAAVIKDMGLEESPILEETLKNGVSKFENKIAFVRLYLVLSGYIDRSKRGVWTLTEKGRNSQPLSDSEIQEMLLEIQRQSKKTCDVDEEQEEEKDDAEETSPEEINYKAQLLTIIRQIPPSGFEQLCQRLLRESGFEQVIVTGRSGDGGIDGIGVLKVNAFVSFKVLFQCKRYIGTVSASEVRDFRGAMQGRADKGIILTTGTFSTAASEEAERAGVPPIELVAGERLIGLFESLELGLKPRTTYDVDLNFFAQFQTGT
ncbi:MAG: restriction endonuclease [Thermoguttaceae bacterium]|jgi:restriction system protein